MYLKNAGIVVHELFDFSPISESPLFEAVQKANLIEKSPF
jgi:hypothetical protein